MIKEGTLIERLAKAAEAPGAEDAVGARMALDQLCCLLRENNSKLAPPSNVPELYQILSTVPCKEYLSSISSEGPFLAYGELNPEVEALVYGNSYEQQEKKVMEPLLHHFRQKMDQAVDETEKQKAQNDYRACRELLSSTRLIGALERDQKIEALDLDIEIENLLRSAYINRSFSEESIEVCPVCGAKALTGVDSICWNPVCKYYIRRNKMKVKTMRPKEKMQELVDGIYHFVLIPSIAEKQILKKVTKWFPEAKIELYPAVDEYDIDVCFDGGVVHLDCKDHQSPEGLVDSILQAPDKLISSKDRTVFVVIPNHRLFLYESEHGGRKYMGDLRAEWKRRSEKNVRFISEWSYVKI